MNLVFTAREEWILQGLICICVLDGMCALSKMRLILWDPSQAYFLNVTASNYYRWRNENASHSDRQVSSPRPYTLKWTSWTSLQGMCLVRLTATISVCCMKTLTLGLSVTHVKTSSWSLTYSNWPKRSLMNTYSMVIYSYLQYYGL